MGLKTITLGTSGLTVTELCFGTLTLSPLQEGLDPQQAGALIRKAVQEGIAFIDTAQGYRNYPHVRAGIKGCTRQQLAIATKSHAKTSEEMQEAFDEACREMGLEYIDIFHIHLIASAEDFNNRHGALEKLKELKAEGRVKAIGMSAHTIEPFRHIIGNSDIDICYPSFNQKGFGINDGTVEEMAQVLKQLHDEGKGIYAMKPLGGGHLCAHFEEAFDFVRGHDCIDAVSVGMKDERELALNLAYFRGEEITDEMKKSVAGVERRLMINRLCRKCGKCVEVCEQNALQLGEKKAEVDLEKCIFCGYCAPECSVFAIRII